MIITAPAADLEPGYEALRARAVGEIPQLTPRGLTVFLRRGMTAWMCALPPQPPVPKLPPQPAKGTGYPSAADGDLVQLLTTMVLNTRRSWA